MRCHPQPTEPVPVLGGHQHAPLPERHLNRVASARLLFERVTPPKLSQSAEESSFIIALDDKVHGWVAGVSMLQLEWLRHPSAMSRTAISFGFATVTPTMCDPPPSAPATGTPNAPASVKPAAVTPARRRSASSVSRCWTYTDTNHRDDIGHEGHLRAGGRGRPKTRQGGRGQRREKFGEKVRGGDARGSARRGHRRRRRSSPTRPAGRAPASEEVCRPRSGRRLAGCLACCSLHPPPETEPD